MKKLIKYYSNTCPPCKAISPILDELEKEFPHVKFEQVNVELRYDLAELAQVMNLPTIILLKNNEEIWRKVGMQSKDTILQGLQLL